MANVALIALLRGPGKPSERFSFGDGVLRSPTEMDIGPKEPPPCVVCGGDRVTRLSGVTCDEAWLCQRCGHTFVALTPAETELDAIYTFYGYDGRDDVLPAFLGDILDALIESFEPYRRTGKLLDVGFGAGLLLKKARARGWKTHGVELSHSAVEHGRAAGIGDLHQGDFAEVPLEAGSFDVVVMTELIEHLPAPQAFIERAAEVLRPDGLLYMTTPHGRGLSGRILGADWSVMKPPEHLHLFSKASARRCLERAGFSRARVYTQGLLPHEIVAKLKTKLPRPSARAPRVVVRVNPTDRVERSYKLNATLMGSQLGRAVKNTANAALRVVGLGDSLRVEAER